MRTVMAFKCGLRDFAIRSSCTTGTRFANSWRGNAALPGLHGKLVLLGEKVPHRRVRSHRHAASTISRRCTTPASSGSSGSTMRPR